MKNTLILLIIILNGCASIKSISYSSFNTPLDPNNTKLIQAEESAIGLMHITAPNLDVSGKLRAQCRSGLIHGIKTTLGMRDLLFVQEYILEASAHGTNSSKN